MRPVRHPGAAGLAMCRVRRIQVMEDLKPGDPAVVGPYRLLGYRWHG